MIGQPFCHRAREGLGGFVGCRGVQWNVDLQTFRTGSLWKAFEVYGVELGFEPLGDLGALENVRRGPRVEIENDHRGRPDIFLFGQERMKLEISEIRGPDNRRQIVRHTVMNLGIVAVGPDGRGLYPFGPVGGAAFLVEKTSGDAIGVTLKRERPVFEVGEQDGRDADVIIDDLALSETGFGIKNFIEIRNRNSLAFDLE